MRNLRTRPFLSQDATILNLYKTVYKDGVLETPYGYEFAPYVETAIAVREDGSIVAALTKTLIAALDPFVHDPNANTTEIATALRRLSFTLEYAAQKDGAAEVVCAVPDHLTEYHTVLEHSGWSRTAPGCFLFRKALLVGCEPSEK